MLRAIARSLDKLFWETTITTTYTIRKTPREESKPPSTGFRLQVNDFAKP